MKTLSFFFTVAVLLLYMFSVQTDKSKTSSPTKVLSYSIADKNKVHLTLSGTVYTPASQNCLIRKEKEDGSDFEQIHPCDGSVQTHGNDRCLRPCTGDNIKLAFNVLSPRTKYMYVYSGQTPENIKDKNTGGDVFGFSIPLLVDPIVTISTDSNTKLKLATKTCPKVSCPIYYKDIQYQAGTSDGSCIAENTANTVDFGLMIPHYEMRCTNYPVFIYKMPNLYMKEKIDIYKPQYYVTYKHGVSEKNKYVLKFTNKFPTEICLFSIKDAADNATGDTAIYASSCGSAVGKKCYAPCNNVELALSTSKPIVKILIQTRNHNLDQTGGNFEGYEEKKFAIVEVASPGTLLTAPSAVGTTLNLAQYNPSGDSDLKFQECSLKYFPADAPRPTDGSATTCASATCGSGCPSSTVIVGLSAGKSYMIKITPTAISQHNDIKEYLFFKTKKADSSNYVTASTTPADVSVVIKAIDGTLGTESSEPTCSYFITNAGKGAFEEAECKDSIPYRGFCRDNKKLINLNLKTSYDIKVISNKDYGEKIFENISTTLSTLALTHNFLDRGFQVTGKLTTAYPQAVCHYKIKEKNGAAFDEVYSCPAIPPPGSSANPQSADTKASMLPQTEGIKVARAGSGGGSTAGSSSSNPVSTKQSKFPACSEAPSCSNIVISEGYEAEKEYQVAVVAVDRSEEVSINIPKNVLEEDPTDETLKIRVVINRGNDLLKVTSILPNGKDDSSLCKWILRDTKDPALPVVKKCNSDVGNSCNLPTCKSFTIEGVSDTASYHLLVIHSEDPTVRGVGTLNEGETSNESRADQTMIIGIVVPILVVVIAIGIYFGYKKKKD